MDLDFHVCYAYRTVSSIVGYDSRDRLCLFFQIGDITLVGRGTFDALSTMIRNSILRHTISISYLHSWPTLRRSHLRNFQLRGRIGTLNHRDLVHADIHTPNLDANVSCAFVYKQVTPATASEGWLFKVYPLIQIELAIVVHLMSHSTSFLCSAKLPSSHATHHTLPTTLQSFNKSIASPSICLRICREQT